MHHGKYLFFSRSCPNADVYLRCHHCKQLAPHYEQAARLMKDAENPVAFAKIDATVEQTLAQEYSIDGYPTIKIFHRNSGKPIDYDGPRQPGFAIADYLKDFAAPTWTPPPSDVVILTKDNFTQFTVNEELTLVEFYAPWCGHCKRLEPKFEKAATLLKKDTNIRLAKVDATVESELAAIHNITGYPSLFVYRKGGKRANYDGEQTEQSLVSTMKEYLSLPSHEVKNLNDYKYLFRQNDRPVIIGVFQNEDDQFYQLFLNYAFKNRKTFQFGHTFEKISSLEDVQAPAIVLQHHPDVRSKFEKEKYIFNNENAVEKDLEEFIQQHQIPLVGILTQENQRNIYLSRRPICIVIYDLDFSFDHRERTQYWRNKILKVANTYKTKYTFAIADEEKMSGLLKEFGLEESDEDVNVGCYDSQGLKYRMEDDDEFTSESFEDFINRLDKGKIQPYFKSQPIPKQSMVNGIQTIVGKNFDKIVKDKSKNVLVFFYAPW
jgi:protein disulfide-isomerase A4